MTKPDDSNPLASGAKAVIAFYVLFALVVMTYTNCAGFAKLSDRSATVVIVTLLFVVGRKVPEPTLADLSPGSDAPK